VHFGTAQGAGGVFGRSFPWKPLAGSGKGRKRGGGWWKGFLVSLHKKGGSAGCRRIEEREAVFFREEKRE